MQISTQNTIAGVGAPSSAAKSPIKGEKSIVDAVAQQAEAAPLGFNMQGLLHSSAVTAVISYDDAGGMHWKNPGRTLTSQESIAWNAYSSANPDAIPDNTTWYSSKLTDQDRSYIRKTTGFNVVDFANGGRMIVDDQGRFPAENDAHAKAAKDLADWIDGDRNTGDLSGDLTPSYINNAMKWFDTFGYGTPADVSSKSKEWFDTLLKMVSDTTQNDKAPEMPMGPQARDAVLAYSQAERQASDMDVAMNTSPTLSASTPTFS
ncbi:hypothetical protein [Asticcacaulis benevestitus]|uniref:Uncharacterized protein n=1 Tax=Asticcacaulis benevestitus DSM 16100 = ATCC BAA-896 TaxID=1121022 RepID=V4Q3W3_9CAUL|nr:hypothetical protein [Asticcacaulis benevestitus]ESQ92545.1 hypothetical protein ABENE_07870 [Asticcacaulis benevestitus DSM 16100 = ATCC BAA-896]